MSQGNPFIQQAPSGTTGGRNKPGAVSGNNGEQQPKVSLPKGGGAIQGIGEKFQANPATGTGSLSIPLAMSPGRSGFTPQLALSYDSGAGNSPFGLGWGMVIPSISRKTQKGIPQYKDGQESDVFLLSGAEDLAPALDEDGARYERTEGNYTVYRYRPRIEGLFARIERWAHRESGHTFWKSMTRENITAIYGQSENARVFHPEDAGKTRKRVFQWLIERTFDDKGNIIYYHYKAEDGANIPQKQSEQKRPPCTQRYLKRVYYGNTRPYLCGGINPEHIEPNWEQWQSGDEETPPNKWLFELVFDYGEHFEEKGAPIHNDKLAGWPCRSDPFSSFRSGFDIRTYRLCRRILMFHHFKELGNEPYLVRSTELKYRENPVAAKLISVAHISYRKQEDGHYERAGMPETQFTYSEPEPDFTIRTVDPEYMDNLPQGIDGGRYRWQGLYGEGVGGILAQAPEAWYYKPNLGPGFDEEGRECVRFGPLKKVAEQPAGANLFHPGQQLVDLGGDGQQNLVIQSPAVSGYYEVDDAGRWKNFRPFEANPNVNWNDPNLRLIDLTGDGHADILITEGHCFVWYRSLAEEGFGPAERVAWALDEETGPRIAFNDAAQSIYLADMTGDGLIDIVRIRNGAVCYWANQGYGRFSSKIRMNNCPVFGRPGQFNPGNLRLADVDGSGTTDIFYLDKGEVRYWQNESGNSWSEAHLIPNFPHTDNLSTVQVLDLEGKGTASLVWSSPLPDKANAPLRYISLMPVKPHLMVEANNNMGAVTKLEYRPSTYFYRQDKKAGKPWVTKVPFPVHVLSRVETHDQVSGNHFVTRYAYHHGYFDGEEREFRGFGMVEQWDTEGLASLNKDERYAPPGANWHETTDVPPVYSKSWYHTGFFWGRGHISRAFQEEYYQGDSQAWLLDDTVLPEGLTAREKREACRALKGSLLRQEVYGEDGTGKSIHPYTVAEYNYTIQRLQSEVQGSFGVFLATSRESLNYHYERNPEDPRIAHTVNLFTDKYGNSTHSIAIVYPRRGGGHSEEQTRLYATLTENLILHADRETTWFRHSLPALSRSFEVHGLKGLYRGKKIEIEGQNGIKQWIEQFFEEGGDALPFSQKINFSKVLDFAEDPLLDRIELRLLSEKRIKYYHNGLLDPLPFGSVESLAIPYETYTLAFTEKILEQPELGNRVTPELLSEGRYRTSFELFGEDEEKWWIPSGRQLYNSPDYQEGPSSRFYLAVGERTPLGVGENNPVAQESFIWYDHFEEGPSASYFLFLEKATDPLGNTLSVTRFNYRILQPQEMLDINNNRSGVAFDIRGMVIATALMGKGKEGDELVEFQELICNESEGMLDSIMDKPQSFLGRASKWFYYDLFAWRREGRPLYAIGLSRALHYHQGGAESEVQIALTYSDGFGREILRKVQAENGNAPNYDEAGNLILDSTGKVEMVFCTDRWVGTGRTIFNNKGKPVKKYEPFFDNNPYFTSEDFLVHFGVTPILHYDPLTRIIQTDFPDGTLSKTAFSAWKQTEYDQNDTILDTDCRWYQERMLLEDDLDPRKIAAQKAAKHALTPTVQYLDALGRPFVNIAHNRYSGNPGDPQSEVNVFIPTHTFFDVGGSPIEIWDGRRCESLRSAEEAVEYNHRGQTIGDTGNCVMRFYYAIGGQPLYQYSMDAGESWVLSDVLGNVIHTWTYKESDDMGGSVEIHKYTTYDALQRPLCQWVSEEGFQQLTELLFYGETAPVPAAKNLRGQLLLHFDGAGVEVYPVFDFKGNPLKKVRRLTALNYSENSSKEDWKDLVPDWCSYEKWATSDLAALVDPQADWEVLEHEIFSITKNYDALNRVIKTVAPENSATYFIYNKANLLEAVKVNPHGKTQVPNETPEGIRSNTGLTSFIENIDYNAKGQRQSIAFGNGVNTKYIYDDRNFRLVCLKSTRSNRKSNGELRETGLQNIRYTYDPVGNFMEIFNKAQPTIFNDNQKVEPCSTFTYDALYQLIYATGRESRLYNFNEGFQDIPILNQIPASDTEVRNFRQNYSYDPVGNIRCMKHISNGGSWTRKYEYEENHNYLVSTYKNNHEGSKDLYHTGLNGNIIKMPNLNTLIWDYKNQLVCVKPTEATKDVVIFLYDGKRQRVRKAFLQDNIVKERIYLGEYEIYRINGEPVLETLHVFDERQRIAMMETPTSEHSRIRYQLNDHLGSSCLELNEDAGIISFEEYHPYGTSSFLTRKSGVEVSSKRYRYLGMERDEETGLEYHGARYYSCFLGRWISPDLINSKPNRFQYGNQNPIKFLDKNGYQDHLAEEDFPPLVPIEDDDDLPPLVPIPRSPDVDEEWYRNQRNLSYEYLLEKMTGIFKGSRGAIDLPSETPGTVKQLSWKSIGEKMIERMMKMRQEHTLPYGGQGTGYGNQQIGGKTLRDTTTTNPTRGRTCSPTTWRAFTEVLGGEIPHSSGEALSVEEDAMFQFLYSMWNAGNFVLWDHDVIVYNGIPLNQRRSAIEVIERLGIGKQIDLNDLQRGDILQTWRAGGRGHSSIVTDVERVNGEIVRIGTISATTGGGEAIKVQSNAYRGNVLKQYLGKIPSQRRMYAGRFFLRPQDFEITTGNN